jgi:hypothetical protein
VLYPLSYEGVERQKDRHGLIRFDPTSLEVALTAGIPHSTTSDSVSWHGGFPTLGGAGTPDSGWFSPLPALLSRREHANVGNYRRSVEESSM